MSERSYYRIFFLICQTVQPVIVSYIVVGLPINFVIQWKSCFNFNLPVNTLEGLINTTTTTTSTDDDNRLKLIATILSAGLNVVFGWWG